MKKTLFTIVLVAAALFGTAQGVSLQPLNIQHIQSESRTDVRGLSGNSAFLLLDLLQGKTSPEELRSRYGLSGSANNLSVGAFVQLADGRSADDLKTFGVTVKRQLGHSSLAVQIPLSRFVELAQSAVCRTLDIGKLSRPALDVARAETGVAALYSGTGVSSRYDGTGVVVGIVDIGFEYAHAAFYDSTGTTLRVKRVWNQKAESGTPPAGYSYGAEYTTPAAIVAAQTDDASETHGTHVAGIAAGCGGSNATAKTYRGVAPAADIVLVATTMSDAGIIDGVQYITDYAASVGKPCVINLSLGSHIGPHDGSSVFDRYSDTLLAGSQGVVLVGAAGNEGDENLHLQKTFDGANDTLLYSMIDFDGERYGTTSIDIWGEPGKQYMAALAIVDTSTGDIVAASNYYLSHVNSSDNTNIASGAVSFYVWQGGSDPYNNRQNIYFRINASSLSQYSGVYRVMLVVKSYEAQTLHAWNNSGEFETCNFTALTAGNTDYTVGETGGSGNSMLSVGSYATRNDWNSTNGYHYSVSQTVGDLSYFSSHGPTLDGRVKPDILAPGQYIAAPVNRFNTSYCTGSYAVANTTIGGVTEYYAVMQGTSMATPFMTGVVALWLQDNPTLTFSQIAAIAHNTARQDSHTGVIPASGSNLYGWGKVSAAGAIGGSVPTPTVYTVSVQSADPTMGTVSGGGSRTAGGTVTISATPNSGYRFLRWQDNNTQNPRTVTVTADATYTAYFESVCTTVTAFPYTESFEGDYLCWTAIDANGDGNSWTTINTISDVPAHSGSTGAVSFSWRNNVAYNADDYLVSPQFVLPSSGAIELRWWFKVNGSYPADKYEILLSSTTADVDAFTTTLFSITPTAEHGDWTEMSVDLTPYAGQTVYIAFHHHDTYDMNYLWIDDVTISPYTPEPPVPQPVFYTVTVRSANTSMGTVEGGGTCQEGGMVRITAHPHDGYRFLRWQDNNRKNPRDVTVTANATYTAYFEALEGIADLSADGIAVSVKGSVLTVAGAEGERVVVSDIMGRTLHSSVASATLLVDLPAAGVYFVRVGDRPAGKVTAF